MGKEAKNDILSLRELSTFCAQIAMIMKSGIPISEGLSIIRDDIKNPQGKAILDQLHAQMEQGDQLHVALADSGHFPRYVVDMTEVGETTGRLDEVMQNLYEHYEREEAIAQSIRSAVTYPLIMIVMMLVVIGVLVVKVLPIFNEVFQQLGGEITGLARTMMNVGSLIGRYSFVIIGILVLLILIYALLRATKGGRRFLQRFNTMAFGSRKLKAKIASGRFASAMALMLASGLNTDQSLDMVYRLVDSDLLKERILLCKQYLSNGHDFSEALVKAEIFTGIYARMINVGFRTGSVDTIMRELADRYQEEVDVQINRMIAIVEPTMVAVLSIIIGLILLSVMLPLLGVMSAIG